MRRFDYKEQNAVPEYKGCKADKTGRAGRSVGIRKAHEGNSFHPDITLLKKVAFP